MRELGKILREAREKQGLDLDKVHRATKIQEKYLSAIEGGDDTVFLAEIYYKSFVKSYAKFLGLNGEDMISQYEKRKGNTTSTEREEKREAGNHVFSKEKSLDIKKLFLTLLIAGCLCGIFVYLNKNISVLTEDNKDQNAAAIEQQKEFMKMQQIQKERQQLAKQQELPQEEKTEESKPLKPFPQKPAAITSALTPVSASVPSVERAPSASAVNSSSMPAVSQQQKPARQELSIEAVENVWIMVEIDGREQFQGTITKGTKKAWNADDGFVVKIGYTPGVKVFFNGLEVDVIKGSVQDVNTVTLKRQ